MLPEELKDLILEFTPSRLGLMVKRHAYVRRDEIIMEDYPNTGGISWRRDIKKKCRYPNYTYYCSRCGNVDGTHEILHKKLPKCECTRFIDWD